MVKVAVQSNHPISKCQRRSGKRFKIPKVNSDTKIKATKNVHECCAKRMSAQPRVPQWAVNGGKARFREAALFASKDEIKNQCF